MNILDENIFEVQWQILKRKRVPTRHIGRDIGRMGMQDVEVIPFLLTLKRPTFFTSDFDFYKRKLCHRKYCLVYLDVEQDKTAYMIRLFLRHRIFKDRAERMGKVFCISTERILFWEINASNEDQCDWEI